MLAVVLEQYGGPEVLTVKEIPDLTPGVGEVRVRVAATALNRADCLQRMGRYPQPEPRPAHEVPGLEFAGTVDALGHGVMGFKLGDRVCGLLSGGGYAQQVVTHERLLIPIPANMSFTDAAAIPEVFLTAYDALVDKADFKPGDSVLVHAGGSGVGTAATQLARLMGASKIFATMGSAEKAGRAAGLGSDRVINYRTESFDEVVLTETAGRGVDVILDFIGAPYLEKNLRSAALEGRLVLISTMGGSKAEVQLGLFMTKRLRMAGTTLRSRSLEQKMILTQRFIKQLMPCFADGRLRPVVDRTFNLDEVEQAHRFMESNQSFGKIILMMPSPA